MKEVIISNMWGEWKNTHKQTCNLFKLEQREPSQLEKGSSQAETWALTSQLE